MGKKILEYIWLDADNNYRSKIAETTLYNYKKIETMTIIII